MTGARAIPIYAGYQSLGQDPYAGPRLITRYPR